MQGQASCFRQKSPAQVAVNHVVELTAEEKAEARQNAIRQYQDDELRKLQNRNKPTAKKETKVEPSLFDF